MKRFAISFLMVILMAVNAIYAEVTFTVKPPTRVYEGDKFPVTFKLTNADGSDLKVAQINVAELSGDKWKSLFNIRCGVYILLSS